MESRLSPRPSAPPTTLEAEETPPRTTEPTTKRSSPRKPIPKHSMYPELDSNVAKLLEPHGLTMTFHPIDTDKSTFSRHKTNVVGRFKCPNTTCGHHKWESKSIALSIRLYPDNRYNARVYHQRCSACKWIVRPELDGRDGTYAERIAYRLKKWSGVQVERVYRDPMPPGHALHRAKLCEGCRAGRCKFFKDKRNGSRKGGGKRGDGGQGKGRGKVWDTGVYH
ncbi:3CxxC-type zinc finger protein [Aspergillus mulundensis]|uniref:3CxxC-type domain-containing protein n=1 Tax=Aspergillus mulundensis TaxID=1810919 RepID=A0A3D8SCI2_9EURO|nr:hypothetical protein DSM5745_04120 [Aspergillus mulundensis]RDW83794.1 hypothetical protein DSM5745_04120 [Aspergillus mulundensis]